MIIDTSILLAIFFNEEHKPWSKKVLEEHASNLKMSFVNLAEVLILLRSRRPGAYDEIKTELFKRPIQFVSPSLGQIEMVAQARIQYPSLNFGDCFVYALAKEQQNDSVATLDSDFLKTDLKVVHPTNFDSIYGMALKAPLNPSPRFKSEDDL